MDNDDLAGRRQPILLLPEGYQVLSIIELKLELPPYTNIKINEMMNGDGTARVGREEFVSTVRTSIVACLFGREDNNRILSDEQRGLTTTIVDKEEWPKEEKRIETAIRLFPDILSEKFYGYYPIQLLAMREADGTYNLQNVSLLPMVIELGLVLKQFDEELRGDGWNLLPNIICYERNEHTTNTTDECFSTVRNWMRKNDLFVTEDIQQYNLVGKMCAYPKNSSEDRLRYLINMAPVTLSLPCYPQQGNWFPMHWAAHLGDIRTFSLLVDVGMQYFPEKLGYVFCNGTHRNDNGTLYRGTPFEFACDKYGQGTVMKLVMDYIQESCSSSTTSTSDANNRETSLLMAAITDETIHRDALFILVRKDPTAALLKLQQQSLRDALYLLWRNDPAVALSNIQQQVLLLHVEEEDDGPTGSTDTTTHSNDINSNGATDTLAAATVSATASTTTTTTTTTVSSPPPATAPTS